MNTKTDWGGISPNFSMGEEMAPELRIRILPLVEQLGLKGGRLLDAGCLDGRNTVPLAASGYFSQVVGVDLPWSHHHLVKLWRMNVPNLEVVEVERAKPYPFPAESFQVVLSWRVVHCILDFEERMEFMRMLFDMVSPHGILVLSVRMYNPEENYHVSCNSDRVLVCERFPGDISRLYYRNNFQFLREVLLAINYQPAQIFSFTEVEINENLKQSVIPCLGVIIQK